ncbi:hypothetical protein [Microbacterium luticocti]|uniref:hypothetical protein n=1 Tax=Microbacterium luticocti TaxID=451764 RepID=UPI0004125F63|nr:hypothetical protein [Microbacterium luticocti]
MSTPSPDDSIRFLNNAFRLINSDVATQLWERGWAVTDPDAAQLEWFWPPTAPTGYAGLPDPHEQARLRRPGMIEPHRTPWTTPTRIRRSGDVWRVEYGSAIAQEPDELVEYDDGEALLNDLERIECWPMSVEETKRIRNERIVEVTYAAAHDDFYRAATITEPYASRLGEIIAWQRYEAERRRGPDSGHSATRMPASRRRGGSLSAQAQIVEAAAWASAVRTARAGGPDWSL